MAAFCFASRFLVLGFVISSAAALAGPPVSAGPSALPRAAASVSPGPAALLQATPRVQSFVDESRRVVLDGNVHPLLSGGSAGYGLTGRAGAQHIVDLGGVEDSFPAGRLLLLLQRSAAQETALEDFIRNAHAAGNPAFHQWLKPEEFGRIYGPADSDVAAVEAWLESHGLTVTKVHTGRVAIEFTGTAGQVREAFQTEIHRYLVEGEAHLASANEPTIPAALAPVIGGLARTSDFKPRPQLKVLGQAQFSPRTHQATPQWSDPAGGGVSYLVAPGDFAAQYDINPVYQAGINGAGQSIAIVSASNVDLSLVQAYQKLFALAANLSQVVVDGDDPGENDAATEAYLDIELAGAVAPGAKVVLYTSAGTALADGLQLAAYRAVEDDQASVISVSYGECEAQLGQGGNALWNALWQQAAAQGQSVFVSAGDGGSAGCDNFDVQQVAYSGLAVNGIASTPYNVAVGGTDFYYSQYAAGAAAVSAQLAGYWSGATISPAASLKKAIPEQAWNNEFGANLDDSGNPANLTSQTIVAGGGGASRAAVYLASGVVTGYAKPAWQSGSGVPADKLRDLPDLSLFAANGSNLSFYPICANPGDCSATNLDQEGAVTVTGVGGTSASSPEMAAIQALVNQSAGSWSGQADFVYYPLALRQPTVFRDVTLGGNQVHCSQGTANCAKGASGTVTSGYYMESGYAAGAGYDLATGLGSVDVANLIKYWSSVKLAPTATTLSVSPSSLVHGQTATVTGTVAATGGQGTPTGAVSLTANDGVSHSTGIGDFPLTSGSLHAAVDSLPGGTYQLTAVYAGDGSFASSKSAPFTVTVAPENDKLTTTGWSWSPYDLLLHPLTSGTTVPYGTQIFLDAQPVSRNATLANQPTPATGAVVFTDKAGTVTTTSTQALNTSGVAEWSTGIFAPGAHTVGASYSGDASYNASSATAAAFTVVAGTTSLVVTPLAASVAAGASVTVDVQLTVGYLPLYGKLPTGKVSISLGSQSQSVAWQASGTTGSASLEAAATFTQVPAGNLPVAASYPGDANWLGSTATGGKVTVLSGKLTPAVTMTTNSASPAPGQTFTLTATLTGPSGKPVPTGAVAFFCEALGFNQAASLASGKASVAIPANSAANGANVFTAVYAGDANYAAATSNALGITVSKADFLLTTLNAEIQLVPAKGAAATLALAPVNGFSGSVTLAASAPAGISASLAKPSPAVNAATTDVLVLSAANSLVPGTYAVTITATGGGRVHTAQILVAVLAPAAPLFIPAAGTYTTAQSVTLSGTASGAAIYYTTNGTTPTTASSKYTGPIQVAATLTIQAIAIASGYSSSPVASAKYTIQPPAAAPTFIPPAGTYTTAQSVVLADASPGATIYYTTNGATPTTASSKYTGPLWVATSLTIRALAVAPGSGHSAVATAAYTVKASTRLLPIASH
jgi:hypothetical protein